MEHPIFSENKDGSYEPDSEAPPHVESILKILADNGFPCGTIIDLGCGCVGILLGCVSEHKKDSTRENTHILFLKFIQCDPLITAAVGKKGLPVFEFYATPFPEYDEEFELEVKSWTNVRGDRLASIVDGLNSLIQLGMETHIKNNFGDKFLKIFTMQRSAPREPEEDPTEELEIEDILSEETPCEICGCLECNHKGNLKTNTDNNPQNN